MPFSMTTNFGSVATPLARVLSDALLQYRIFVASMKRYRDEILARHIRELMGRPDLHVRDRRVCSQLPYSHSYPGLTRSAPS